MLGFADIPSFLGYLFTILVTVGCIVFGIIYWNKEI